jgi:hypothetical protein
MYGGLSIQTQCRGMSAELKAISAASTWRWCGTRRQGRKCSTISVVTFWRRLQMDLSLRESLLGSFAIGTKEQPSGTSFELCNTVTPWLPTVAF